MYRALAGRSDVWTAGVQRCVASERDGKRNAMAAALPTFVIMSDRYQDQQLASALSLIPHTLMQSPRRTDG